MTPPLGPRVLITGGTGSLGRALLTAWLPREDVTWLGAFSRDEVKQAEVAEAFGHHPKLRLLLGDVRDSARLEQAFWGVNTVIHAAALKRVDSVADNPDEVLRTNLDGTRHVIQAAVRAGVSKVLLISSDKSVAAQNVYGISKAAAEHVAICANKYTAPRSTIVAAVRYGNVLGSRGSVVHLWRQMAARGEPLKLTHPDMTRFWLTLSDAVRLVEDTLGFMQGGELVVPVLPSVRLTDLAEAIAPGHPIVVTGLRAGGEKLAERLLTSEEVTRAVARLEEVVYVVTPAHRSWSNVPYEGLPVDPTLDYVSDRNAWWLTVDEVRALLETVS